MRKKYSKSTLLALSWASKKGPGATKHRSEMIPKSSWNRASFFDRFRFRFGAVWGATMGSKIDTELPGGGPWGVQGGLGLVLVRSFVRLVARVRFFDPLALLLGPFGTLWGYLGPLLG